MLKDLSECYARPSSYKVEAYRECRNTVHELEDFDYTFEDYGVVSFNSFLFSFGAMLYNRDKNEKHSLMIYPTRVVVDGKNRLRRYATAEEIATAMGWVQPE